MSKTKTDAQKVSNGRSHRPTRISQAVLLALVLGGCAVQPQPFDAKENQARSEDLAVRANADQEPVAGPIDLYEAMARAIKYNLDGRVELMNLALAQRELDLSRYDMLPKLVANVDYAGRDNYSGGISKSLLTGQTSLEPSTSSEKNVVQSDLTLSWDVLDFGLSYVRAKQAADRVSIADERKRKVINRLIEDVRTAYWRAVSAERLLTQIQELERATQAALDQSERQEKVGLTAPLGPLSYQRELLSIRRDAQSLGRELGVAKQQLAALMNLPPNTAYKVVLPSQKIQWRDLDIPGVGGKDSAALLKIAIENRPELREVAYQLRSNDQEGTAAYLRNLPSLKLFFGGDYSTNDFLWNNNWVGWGARASWNLLNVFRLPADQEQVKAAGQLLDQRQLALTTAVATQVEVSRARYALRLEELKTAQRYNDVQGRIGQQIDAGYKAEKLSRQTQIREQMNSLVSNVRYDLALADLQNAYANVYASLGIDPVEADMSTTQSVSELAGRLRTMWSKRNDAVAVSKRDVPRCGAPWQPTPTCAG
ncbi:MAG: TolC family protein [Proteobacteria bacterium]|nr:TolC family protein [Pseudomonadota bacterium]